MLLIAACKGVLVGRLQPGKTWKRSDAYQLQRSLMLIGQIPFGHTFVGCLNFRLLSKGLACRIRLLR